MIGEALTADGETRLRMHIEERRPLARAKEMRVQIPAHMHLKLHMLRIHTGVGISEIVEAALRAHFDRVAASRETGLAG